MSVTGIVLAGGRSARFGGPKLQAELDGTPLLHHAITSLDNLADEILVAGPELPRSVVDAGVLSAPVRLVVDRVPFDGPLAALAGALDVAGADVALVVGGDMPRLVPGVLRAMLDRLAGGAFDAVLLGSSPEPSSADRTGRSGGIGLPRREVLPVALRVPASARAAREALDGGDRSMRALLERLSVDELEGQAWRGLDPAGATLLDVDTRADLDRVALPHPGDPDR